MPSEIDPRLAVLAEFILSLDWCDVPIPQDVFEAVSSAVDECRKLDKSCCLLDTVPKLLLHGCSTL